jgi:hypothetical protein
VKSLNLSAPILSAPILLPVFVLTLLLFALPAHAQFMAAESSSVGSAAQPAEFSAEPAFSYAGGQPAPAVIHRGSVPFSRLALGAIISPLGVGAEAAVKVHDHFDVRVMGNLFSYSTSFNTNGFNIDANLHMASAGASLDYYPFHNGFRLSPGILAYNQNRADANAPVTPGTSFTLNNQTFYAATPNPALGITALSGTGALGLHSTRPAFTATTGWGSLIPRSGRHWAIPFEIGAAFTGSPTLNMNLTGWACYDQAQTLCTNVNDPSNPISVQIQNDLQAQLAKWKNDLDPLKVYPIISTGIVFNFNIR